MERRHWLDDERHVKQLWRGFLATLVLTVIAGWFVDLHPHFEVEALFGFYAAYGLLTCVAMIVAAKLLGLALKRDDRYYGDGNSNE